MPAPQHLHITNATILDIAEGSASPDSSILVEDGVITWAGHAAELPADRATGETIDAGGKYVMPGLIDGHVHVTAGTADLATMAEWSPTYVAAHTARNLRAMLHRGFTTVRDVAGADFGVAMAVEEGLFEGPRVIFGGKALSQSGGHGDMRSMGASVIDPHQCCPSIGIVCDGVDAVRKAARDQLRTGAHHIKVMLSGGVASPTDRVDSTQFSESEILAVIEEAEGANRYVCGHAYTARAVNRGLRLGVRCIEHGNLIDDESVRLFVEKDAYLVPTLITYERLKADGEAAGLPAASREKVDIVLHAGLEALDRANKGGVKIVFGTDLLGAMQIHQSEEFRIRAQVQTAQEVLRSATLTAAELIGLEGRLGVIAADAFADLLILNENPLDDVTVLADPESSISAVIQGGRVIGG
ncbi:amidohydrolase family protein [Arthrobacter sp. NamB2]|uniref:metal-dependent hydrolase family protein n=1 Tax=Arthrobacter sp. NamB2 TaxID=2576035 RepID=UPI0010C959A4|nr:amidohydrolase family protein [Arthrobacter sp. NamB2]TKV28569.1 amidohydrolase family protein [Arthrobacter sp. NamB2]